MKTQPTRQFNVAATATQRAHESALAVQRAEEIAAEIEIRADIERGAIERFERGEVEPLVWAALESLATWHR